MHTYRTDSLLQSKYFSPRENRILLALTSSEVIYLEQTTDPELWRGKTEISRGENRQHDEFFVLSPVNRTIRIYAALTRIIECDKLLVSTMLLNKQFRN